MEIDRADIISIIRNYRSRKSSEDYFTVKNWYEENIQTYPDQEFMVCVYLFLLGANIRGMFVPFTRRQNMDWIEEIRSLIEDADPFFRTTRKVFLDCGTKD